jgi:serine phosphatase RsbU (regulator of sigma subunit)/anti-sigma regulatory factor (Ser/Thr protein kinase)
METPLISTEQAPSISRPAGLKPIPGLAGPAQIDAEAGVESGRIGRSFGVCVPIDLAVVRPKVLEVRSFLVQHHVSEQDVAACELALTEACNNAILYSLDGSKLAGIELVCQDHLVELQVIDHTPGLEWPTHAALPNDDAEHGRGLFIIQSVMDETLYLRSPRENRLVMRKKLKPLAERQGHESPQPGEVEQHLALSKQVLNSMANELCQQVIQARLHQEEMDSRLVAHELEIARKIQQSLLPRIFPSLPGFSLSGFCLSARQVGGDFYDLILLPNDCLLLAVADVMGKGVPAALFAATLRTLLRTATEWTQHPAELLGRINRLMYEELTGVDMFITAQLAVADPHKGLLQVASAGHNPLLYVSPDGRAKAVSPDGMPLGILPDVRFAEEMIPLKDIKAALLFTDGLTEARNAQGELFGHQRLADWLVRNCQRPRTAKQLADNFLGELARFQDQTSLKDDQTFLMLAQDLKPAPVPLTADCSPLTIAVIEA